MENKECVIIPLKEYNALKERVKELKRDHPDISIEWGYSHERYGYFYSSRGKLILSEGLNAQIRRICALINEEMSAKIDEREKKLHEKSKMIERNIKEYIIDKISCLPWYKRLWFKPKYIK